jgi:hypothetical protein
MTHQFFKQWMQEQKPLPKVGNVLLLREHAGRTADIRKAIELAALDHLANLEVIERMGGTEEAKAFIRNKLSSRKSVESGDLGEILASEYIDQCTDYRVPIKRLRWKDDRNVTMRGNDVIAVRDVEGRLRTLKAEAKSGKAIRATVVNSAIADLQKHAGRPNPSSLAFISSRLRELGRDAEAVKFEALQKAAPAPHEVEHMVFTLSGNDPSSHFAHHCTHPAGSSARRFVGCVVADHQEFIRQTFEALNASKP